MPREEPRAVVDVAGDDALPIADVDVPPRDVGDAEGVQPCPVYARARLLAGQRLAGPAVIEQFDATTMLLPGQEARVDELGFLVIREA